MKSFFVLAVLVLAISQSVMAGESKRHQEERPQGPVIREIR